MLFPARAVRAQGKAGGAHGHTKGLGSTPLKIGVLGLGGAGGGGVLTPGGGARGMLLPLFARPPKEPDSAL